MGELALIGVEGEEFIGFELKRGSDMKNIERAMTARQRSRDGKSPSFAYDLREVTGHDRQAARLKIGRKCRQKGFHLRNAKTPTPTGKTQGTLELESIENRKRQGAQSRFHQSQSTIGVDVTGVEREQKTGVATGPHHRQKELWLFASKEAD
jgi:hypothetical protein